MRKRQRPRQTDQTAPEPTSFRLSDESRERLRRLSRKLNSSQVWVVEEALRRLEEEIGNGD